MAQQFIMNEFWILFSTNIVLPGCYLLSREVFRMRNVWWENLGNMAFLFGKIFHLKLLNENFSSHLLQKNYKKIFLDVSHVEPSDAAICYFKDAVVIFVEIPKASSLFWLCTA